MNHKDILSRTPQSTFGVTRFSQQSLTIFFIALTLLTFLFRVYLDHFEQGFTVPATTIKCMDFSFVYRWASHLHHGFNTFFSKVEDRPGAYPLPVALITLPLTYLKTTNHPDLIASPSLDVGVK